MRSYDEHDTAPHARVTTKEPTPPDGGRGGSPGRSPRRRISLGRLAAAVFGGVVLGLVVASLLFWNLGGMQGVLGLTGWFQTPPGSSATPTAGQSTATPPGAQGTPHTGISGSPQGCALGSVGPRPAPYLIYSARGYAAARGEVALTFDDGPSPYTQQILNELAAAGAHATFFDVGAHARRYPDLVRAELRGGHAVGNHSYTHPDLAALTPADIRWQLTTTTTTLRTISHDNCLWLFRPPYGLGGFDTRVFSEANREGLTTIIWDVWAMDWLRPGTQVIAQRIISQLHSGAIILLHDGAPDNEIQDRSQTANAVPAILAAIHAHGLRTVTLPQMLSDAGLVRLRGSASPPVLTPVATPVLPPGTEGMLTPPAAAAARTNPPSLPLA